MMTPTEQPIATFPLNRRWLWGIRKLDAFDYLYFFFVVLAGLPPILGDPSQAASILPRLVLTTLGFFGIRWLLHVVRGLPSLLHQRTVTLHEQGLLIGTQVVTWAEIDGITYQATFLGKIPLLRPYRIIAKERTIVRIGHPTCEYRRLLNLIYERLEEVHTPRFAAEWQAGRAITADDISISPTTITFDDISLPINDVWSVYWIEGLAFVETRERGWMLDTHDPRTPLLFSFVEREWRTTLLANRTHDEAKPLQSFEIKSRGQQWAIAAESLTVTTREGDTQRYAPTDVELIRHARYFVVRARGQELGRFPDYFPPFDYLTFRNALIDWLDALALPSYRRRYEAGEAIDFGAVRLHGERWIMRETDQTIHRKAVRHVFTSGGRFYFDDPHITLYGMDWLPLVSVPYAALINATILRQLTSDWGEEAFVEPEPLIGQE